MADHPIEFVEVSKLLLDEDNPRLPEELKPRTQAAMVSYIAGKGAIEDLMSSIGKNGFFVGEALVVYRNQKDKPGMFRVIEGNRRLTAVKLLLDPSQFLNRPSIQDLASQAKDKAALAKLPVVRFATRQEVLPYLGSRHIVGVRQWEPLAKARYMKQMLDAVHRKGQPAREGYRAVAAQIGSYRRSDHIKSNLDGLAVYELIEGRDFFGIPGLSEEKFNFGTLYTALGYDPIAEYVGAAKLDGRTKGYTRLEPIHDPTVLKPDRVEHLARWLYEADDDGATVLGESRNLDRLAKVLAVPEARKQLETGAPLDIAYGHTSGINDDLMKHLQDARRILRAANGIAPSSHPDSSHISAAKELVDLAESLDATLQRKLRRPQ
jgi:hypothetical protein